MNITIDCEGLGLADRKISIIVGEVVIEADMNDSVTAEMVWQALPIDGRANTWGDEIYFQIPVSANEENAEETVEFGDLGYWPPGEALCLFFGPTPMSRGEEIRPASPVNVIGKMLGDVDALKSVVSGSPISIEAVA